MVPGNIAALERNAAMVASLLSFETTDLVEAEISYFGGAVGLVRATWSPEFGNFESAVDAFGLSECFCDCTLGVLEFIGPIVIGSPASK